MSFLIKFSKMMLVVVLCSLCVIVLASSRDNIKKTGSFSLFGVVSWDVSGSTLGLIRSSSLQVYSSPFDLHNIATNDIPLQRSKNDETIAVSVGNSMIAVAVDESVFTYSDDGNGYYMSSPPLIGADGSDFGRALSMSEDILMVSQLSSREVLVYKIKSDNKWKLTQTLTQSTSDSFGHAVAVSDHLALVSSPTDNVVFSYVLRDDQWMASGKLSGKGLGFGVRVSLDGHIAAVADEKSTHIYQYTAAGEWVHQLEISAAAAASNVAVSDGLVYLSSEEGEVTVYSVGLSPSEEVIID